MTWIWPYYSNISDWDKNLTVIAFQILEDENLECIIFIATNLYSMRIDNLNVRLII